MDSKQLQNRQVKRLIAAFEEDGFQVDRQSGVFHFLGGVGITAIHRTATIGKTGKRKKAYYVEGNPYEMGYLLGLMAEPDIERMCEEYVPNMILSFIREGTRNRGLIKRILTLLLRIATYWVAGNIYPDVPLQYKIELEGVLEGCRAANPETKTSWDELWVLNFGFDALLSIVYVGGFQLPEQFRFDRPIAKSPLLGISAQRLQIPLMCNGFSVFGTDPSTGQEYHYLGRDFMFSTAGVFQDTACMIIQKPQRGLPFVSMTAPGIIGSMAAMNANGVGAGVDMAPGGNCDPTRAGLNSLLLVRHSIENGRTCEEAVDVMVDAQRGVSWIYVLGDGTNQKACIVESGRKVPALDPLSYPPQRLKPYLPDEDYLAANPSTEDREGLMVRWSDYRSPAGYLEFNEGLFAESDKRYDPTWFGDRAYVNRTWKDENCPSTNYFPPQRENNPNLVLTSNGFLIPEMRLCSMYEWTSQLARGHENDIQWRYDELSNELLTALDKGYISYDEARQIVNFVRPDERKFASYYDPKGLPLVEVPIEGSVSLMDLKARSIESHYGYSSDEWVTLHLDNYLAQKGM
jgi:hypothetical protein